MRLNEANEPATVGIAITTRVRGLLSNENSDKEVYAVVTVKAVSSLDLMPTYVAKVKKGAMIGVRVAIQSQISHCRKLWR